MNLHLMRPCCCDLGCAGVDGQYYLDALNEVWQSFYDV
jgi:hypothetical protein